MVPLLPPKQLTLVRTVENVGRGLTLIVLVPLVDEQPPTELVVNVKVTVPV